MKKGTLVWIKIVDRILFRDFEARKCRLYFNDNIKALQFHLKSL